MSNPIRTLFTDETLLQIPIFFRFLSESETKKVEELRIGGRFSICEKYFSNSYMAFFPHKPISNEDITIYYEE